MKSLFLRVNLLGLLVILGFAAQGQTLSGTYTLPGTINGVTVDNLTTLSFLLNNAANPVSGSVIFEFGQSYNAAAEVFPVTFNGFNGTGSVTIRPSSGTSGLLTSGNIAAGSVVLLNNADNFTFDGRPGGTGTTIGWTFQNTAFGKVFPTFHLVGASNNVLQYLQIEGRSISDTSGTIYLSGGGNSSNLIQYNNITNYSGSTLTPVHGIYANGTAANPNSFNRILNNNISNFTPTDFFTGSGITVTGSGGGTNFGDNWTISGNSFYRDVAELGNIHQYSVVDFMPGIASHNNLISNNFIGGSEPLANGLLTTSANGSVGTGYTFAGIKLMAGSTTISGNTIKNITLTGIANVSLAGVLIPTGNTADFTISGNTIDSTTSSGVDGQVGIMNQSTGNVFITDNTILRIATSNGANAHAGRTIGIYSDNGTNTITNNTIYNLSVSGNHNPDTLRFKTSAIAAGIVAPIRAAGAQTISNNTIYNLHSAFPSILGWGGPPVIGIEVYSIAHNAYNDTLNGNIVYNLSGTVDSEIIGLHIISGNYLVANNVITLGKSETGATLAATITGILFFAYRSDSNTSVRIWHNSVNIVGTNAFKGYSYCFYDDRQSYTNNIVEIKNNIFANFRSSGSGLAYNHSIRLDGLTNVVSDYNILFGSGTRYVTGFMSQDYTTLASWKIATRLDSNSIALNPQYLSPATTTPDLHITNTASPANGAGTALATIVYDKDSTERSTASPVDIGAYVVGCGSGTVINASITADPASSCAGAPVTLTALPFSAVLSANYHFYHNGISVQNGPSNTYTTSSLADNDSVWVVISTNASCISPASVYSDTVIVTVTPTVTPTVLLAASQNDVCTGEPITFTATASNGGTAPMFNFYRNGVSVQNGSSNTYTTNSLINGDSVSVILTSNACNSPISATAPGIIAVIKPNATSTLSQTICAGDSYFGYSTAGVYTDTFAAANGCDSIRTLNLSVSPQADSTLAQTICAGDSYLGYSATGVYTDTFISGNGCDSIRTLNLSVRPQNGSTLAQTICSGQSFEGYTATGTYTDVLTDANGCDSTRTINLTVTPPDQVTISQTICTGDTFEGYTTAGTYIDSFTTSGGCDSVRIISLSVNALPAKPVITRTDNVLSIPPTYTAYQWYQDGNIIIGATGSSIASLFNGSFTVVVTDVNGCFIESDAIVITGVGIDEAAHNWNLEYYPNPTGGTVTLQLNGIPTAQWTLYSHLGQLLQQGTAVDNTIIDLQRYAEGMYYLKVQVGNELVTKKVLLVR